MIEFTLTRTSTAPIETVFDGLTDHRGIADYVWACRRKEEMPEDGYRRRCGLSA
jgi:uncharacterized protein YndB with AHSA1/START domain